MADIVDSDAVLAALNLTSPTSEQEDEIDQYIAAVTAHVTEQYGTMPSGTYTERLSVFQGRLTPSRWPVLEVTEVVNVDALTTTYDDDFTIWADAQSFEHDSVTYGTWNVTYVAGYATVPADLQLAALEDIRGLFQPGQIGPPAAFGAFGIDSTDVGTTYRPVRMWPRVDAWIEARRLPGVA